MKKDRLKWEEEEEKSFALIKEVHNSCFGLPNFEKLVEVVCDACGVGTVLVKSEDWFTSVKI